MTLILPLFLALALLSPVTRATSYNTDNLKKEGNQCKVGTILIDWPCSPCEKLYGKIPALSDNRNCNSNLSNGAVAGTGAGTGSTTETGSSSTETSTDDTQEQNSGRGQPNQTSQGGACVRDPQPGFSILGPRSPCPRTNAYCSKDPSKQVCDCTGGLSPSCPE